VQSIVHGPSSLTEGICKFFGCGVVDLGLFWGCGDVWMMTILQVEWGVGGSGVLMIIVGELGDQ
jgi:hypothetical protein